MAEDSEKRFHSIMDKLFQYPRSNPKASSSSPSSSVMQLSRGRKRPNPMSGMDDAEEVQPSAGVSQVPLCRPWDRDDLLRRLATFKSMTWFAKPQVVSAVNCARRGWVNVDTDTIGCEACGARVFFSTSSSWSREQVEKAALVFSLKLDNGHKLLCPWMDNSCDETLAQFPPTPPPVLADQFRERSSLLAHLLALPVISSLAIELMRSPQLGQFLQQSSKLEYGHISPEIPSTEYQENGCDAESSHLYYQALKLISLCGWEPRVLPYVFDCKMDLSNGAAEETNSSKFSKVLPGNDKSLGCTPAADLSSGMEANRNFGVSSESVADPKSVVLDCKLCGASVGLWAFLTVARPVEVFRLVGFARLNNEKNGSTKDAVDGNHSHRVSSGEPNAPSSNSSLTIAGGPPPTQQNFKATISLPVIGRSIRARFSSDPDLRNRLLINQEDNQSELRGTTVSLGGEESNRAIGDMGDNHPPSLTDNPTEGIDSQTSSTHPNDISGETSTQNDTEGLCQNNNMPKDAKDVGDAAISSKKELLGGNIGERTLPGTTDKGMEFDPIRQHRHFCPWIASTGGMVPGWQQVLSALQRQKENPNLSPTTPASASVIKVDDPITSVRRLFTSKRTKSSQR
ncbi:uncharacterized protein LOC116187574 isoform X1 [Punica granatum]|uniref:Uncharacterized protein LOC116187574 isoform X1 n=2 Tax=Punica granatum TaxID=22663 RepID=A0A6P8BQA8_PUNGR|nr:uncharacterized protein LOC116187574 isoform X1 [Punica granatum]XP_031372219.1 uncharacterized protein LOC116187574 isoform X1 [Punica granatum]XP_031372220.1 uncharacterized protein LOC116187574 isoform X1 [Punica granatum]